MIIINVINVIKIIIRDANVLRYAHKIWLTWGNTIHSAVEMSQISVLHTCVLMGKEGWGIIGLPSLSSVCPNAHRMLTSSNFTDRTLHSGEYYYVLLFDCVFVCWGERGCSLWNCVFSELCKRTDICVLGRICVKNVKGWRGKLNKNNTFNIVYAIFTLGLWYL